MDWNISGVRVLNARPVVMKMCLLSITKAFWRMSSISMIFTPAGDRPAACSIGLESSERAFSISASRKSAVPKEGNATKTAKTQIMIVLKMDIDAGKETLKKTAVTNSLEGLNEKLNPWKC